MTTVELILRYFRENVKRRSQGIKSLPGYLVLEMLVFIFLFVRIFSPILSANSYYIRSKEKTNSIPFPCQFRQNEIELCQDENQDRVNEFDFRFREKFFRQYENELLLMSCQCSM